MKIADSKVLIVFFLTAFNALSFEALMTVQPPLVTLNESAALRVEVRGAKNPQPPALPDVPGLRIEYSGQSTQMNWVNGKSDSFVSFNYTVYPQQTGTFSIGPFDYRLNGETKKLGGQLKVTAGSETALQAQNWDELLFAKLTASRETAYVQEPFTLTLSIYSRQGLQLAGNINLTGMPGTGLDGLQWNELTPEREIIDQTVYDIRRFQTRTRALGSGTFEFAPSVTVQVAVPNPNGRSRSPFDDPFFGSMFNRVETRPVDIKVESTSLNVLPLPEEGKPTGFSGAVGRFNLQVSAQPLAARAGDPVTLTSIVSGDGNFDRITAPSIAENGLFRLYGEPVRKQADSGVIFEQVISPKNQDVHEIPPVSFSFFDTQSGKYRTVASAPIPLSVSAVSNHTAQVFAAKESILMPPPETPFATESDLQRIFNRIQVLRQHIRPWLWTVPAAAAAAAMLFGVHRLHGIRQSNTARVRRQKAPKAARHALRSAGNALRQNNMPAFYDALWNALADYFGHRLNLPPGNATPDSVLRILARVEVDEEYIRTLRQIFERVEICRYGLPDTESSQEKPEDLKNRLELILKQCEKINL